MSAIAIPTVTSRRWSPIALPGTNLLPGNGGQTVAAISLGIGQTLSVPYLLVHFLAFKTLGFLGKRNSGVMGLALAIYYNDTLLQDDYEGVSMLSLGLELPGVKATNQLVEFTAPGLYRFVLRNNSASASVYGLVTGSAWILDNSTS